MQTNNQDPQKGGTQSMPITYFDGLPKDDTEAKERADRFVNVDPFDTIPPALLSSEHVRRYILQIGMLYPFDVKDKDNFKAASCEINMGGTYIRWNEDKSIVEEKILPLARYTFPANSITYVQIRPFIRLPNYIAMRFNLRIKHVHRGLLLGTGPLVDPGYRGNLVIPIHNLTATDYTITGGDGLIWAEFTKTSYNQTDNGFIPTQPRIFDQPPKYWLDKAAGKNTPIQNSIPSTITIASKMAQEAKEAALGSQTAAENVGRLARNLSIGAGIGVGLTLLGILVMIYQLFYQVKGDLIQAEAAINSSTFSTGASIDAINAAKDSANSCKAEIVAIRSDVASTKIALDEATKRIKTLESELSKSQNNTKSKDGR